MPTSNRGSFFAKALRDPLVHFIILGGLLFVLVSLWGHGSGKTEDIIITPEMRTHVANLFEATWQRKPTPSELDALMDDQIKEEIYYREALKLGLDQNDTIVRRRMRQKLEFLQEDASNEAPPTEAQLRAFYETHKAKYTTDRHLSFTQILLAPQRLTPEDPHVAEAKKALGAGADPAKITRSSLLPLDMKLETAKTVSDTFGKDFLAQISKLKTGVWAGPITSGFGTHLVRIRLNQPPQALSFEQARTKLKSDFMRTRREKSAKTFYENLRKNYHVIRKDMSRNTAKDKS